MRILILLICLSCLGCGNTLNLQLWNRDQKLDSNTNAGFSGNSARDPYFTDSLKANGTIQDSIKAEGQDSGTEVFHPYETEPPQ